MTGVGLLVHLVHYPLFAHVAAEQFVAFHRAHSARITWIVAPLMGLELATGAALVALQPQAFWMGCVSLSALCFVATGLLAVPQHTLLGRGWDAAAHMRLVRTNWLRTLGWTLHSVILVAWLVRALPCSLQSPR